jgi:hypothetical protein
MPRYMFRVEYTYSDDTVSYEPVCVDATDEADARTQVEAATDRYLSAAASSRTLTVVTVVV